MPEKFACPRGPWFGVAAQAVAVCEDGRIRGSRKGSVSHEDDGEGQLRDCQMKMAGSQEKRRGKRVGSR